MSTLMLEDISSKRFKFVALIGLLGHPLYFFYWKFFYPEYQDSAFLRFGAAFIFLLVLLSNHWPDSLKAYKNHLWYFGLLIALPVIFTYTMFANNYIGLWLASHVGMMLLLLACVQQAKTYFFLLLLGTLIGGAWYSITLNGDFFKYFPLEYIPLFLFLNIVGVYFSHLAKLNIVEKQLLLDREKQKNKIFKSLAGSIAHEMRNPLSQIYGAIHLLKNHNRSNHDEFHEYYEDVIDVIKNSHQIIDITMDAINEKPIDKLNFQLISAMDICQEAVSSYAYKDVEHRKKISVVGGDFQILVDPVLVKYILYNLIGNALYYVQHMPKAEIVISSFAATRQIQVRDTGPGIAPENLSKLFDSFYTSGKSGGTGLGLAYCKRTMEALDGDIYCDSELGEHTAFRLSFPDLAMQKRA
jgi:two-component system CAI-1 autoinducer sensor kinase/phosphatase CqsS